VDRDTGPDGDGGPTDVAGRSRHDLRDPAVGEGRVGGGSSSVTRPGQRGAARIGGVITKSQHGLDILLNVPISISRVVNISSSTSQEPEPLTTGRYAAGHGSLGGLMLATGRLTRRRRGFWGETK